MMGIKMRVFGPLVNVTLDDLVPADHFYRHLDRTLDLTFVRDLVRDREEAFGRPSIDPVVFFKLQLVMFFEGMRSERRLERVGADRLSVRWYLGYDLHEPLPDHSSMTRIRDHYGVQIFRQFFAVLMRQHNHGVHLRYRDHYLVDGGKARIILGVLVTAADVMENIPFLDMVWRACFRWHLRPRSATGDTTYGTVEIIRALEDAGIRAYVPITDWDKRSSFFGREAFRYDAEADQYGCPNDAILQWERHDYVNQTQTEGVG